MTITRNAKKMVTSDHITQYWDLFVNRGAYCVQSPYPHPVSGRHYYFRPNGPGNTPADLTPNMVRLHLEGRLTLGIYAIDPDTQRCKWLALDGDYDEALSDLIRFHDYAVQEYGVKSALEESRRGAHLWVFGERPMLAQHCRTFAMNLCRKLKIPVKGTGPAEGVEIFPKQDTIRADEYGNAIRAPLGVHRKTGTRFWFADADGDVENQLVYLTGLPKLGEDRLGELVEGLLPKLTKAEELWVRQGKSSALGLDGTAGFQILAYVEPKARIGRNHIASCPSCTKIGRDTSGDNLMISVEEPWKYICWAGCTKDQIREALGTATL